MKSQEPAVPLTLRAALPPVHELEGVELTSSWAWHGDVGYWALRCTLQPSGLERSGPVPQETVWYVVASSTYPEGPVRFCPAKDGGIEATYPHMLFNDEGQGDAPWRSCWICLDTRVRALGRFGSSDEPSGYRARLSWRFERALHWLELASRGELTKKGEPFELPVLPVKKGTTVVFDESPEDLPAWGEAPRCGRADLGFVRRKPDVAAITNFESPSGEPVSETQWGHRLSGLETCKVPGVWIRLDEVPFVAPWQAPETWRELREVCRSQDINLNRQLGGAVRTVKPGTPMILLVGFPLPTTVGESPQQQHWQAALLPARRARYDRSGFRPKSSWEGYRKFELRDSGSIQWMRSENWSVGEVSTRGRLSEATTSKHVSLLGAGALGSAVGELLARGSLPRITVVDGEHFEAGNLVRHTLTLDALKEPKAQQLAGRLNTLSPHADAGYINASFPPSGEEAIARLRETDVVLDCTGEDSVLRDMQTFDWNSQKHFFSLSLGMRARRVFCFYAEGGRFPYEAFERQIAPWLDVERREFSGEDLQWEGTGCYHPVFEARQDDVSLLASLAIKWIEKRLRTSAEREVQRPELVVFEQHEQDGVPQVRRAQLETAYA